MKSIVFLVVCFINPASSFAQTLNPADVKSKKETSFDFSGNNEGSTNPDYFHFPVSLFSGAGDVLDSSQYWSWDLSIDEWVLTNRTFYELDINGNFLNQVVLEWNGIQWVNSRRDEWTYDANNNQLTALLQSWNGSAWENINLTTNIYDADHNRTSRTIQNWDGTMWVNANRQLFTYDDHHNVLTRTTGTWLGTEWSNGVRTMYTYNDDHLLVLQEVQHWSGVDYVTDQRVLYVYTSEGDLDTSLTQSWETDHWVNLSRNIYEYDANHNRTSYLNQMAFGDSTWLDVQRFTFTFDPDNIITGQLYEAFIGGEWINQYRFLVENDARQNRITEVFQIWEDEWVNQDSFHYYYTLATGISTNFDPANFNIYPNPATTTLNINQAADQLSNGSFIVFSQNGIKMMKGDLDHSAITAIDVDNLVSGIYFVVISNGNKNSMHPFIKLKR